MAGTGSDDGYFAPPVSKRPDRPPPPSYPPPPPTAFGGYAGPPLPPGGRVAVSEMDSLEQSMLASAARTSYGQMGMSTRPGHYPVGAKMSLLERIGAGLDLAKTCWTVLRSEPMLLLVPIMTLLAGAAVIVPVFLLGGGFVDPSTHRAAAAVQGFVLLVVLTVIGNLGGAVVISAATTRLEGLRPDLGKSWRLALSKLPQLTGLGVIMAAERTLTNTLRDNALGKILAGLIDRAFDFATFLAIPAILFENVGPLRSIKRSGELVASRWGSQLVARGLLNLAVFVCSFPLLLAMLFLGWMFSPVVGVVLFCLGLLIVVAVSTALSGILSAAMYRFAVTGLVVPGFREADMWRVFSRA
ncbi:hypothetical protein acdb102_32440 [Acidothermaceae bacterium B102]|nr:hypothetical protein acdb102_32440 [Acidothermaceae bacterium B102]